MEALNIFLRGVAAVFKAGKLAKIPAEDLRLIEHSLRLVRSELEDITNLEKEILAHSVNPDVKKSWQMQWLVKKKIFERVKEELNAIKLGGAPELLDLETITRECEEEESLGAPQGHS